MPISLCGAHRVGKTTLAKSFSEQSGIRFLESSTNAVASELGLSIDPSSSFDDRMTLQEAILARHIQEAGSMRGPFVSDRCPIDFAAYTLATLGMRTNEAENGDARLIDYMDRCLKVTGSLFSAVVLVHPGIEYVSEEGKPPPQRGYQQLIHHICVSCLHDARVVCPTFMMRQDMLDLDIRVGALGLIWERVLKDVLSEEPITFH
jgi:hypothetical protein